MAHPSVLKPDLDEIEYLTSIAIDRAREDFLAYILLVNPNFIVAPHHRLMADRFMELKDGKIDRLMFFLSPRSSKSLMSSVYFPSWCLGIYPSWQAMALSYSSKLAEDNGREVRNLINADTYKMVFPHMSLRPDSRSASRWHTNHNGVFTSAGITGGIAGRGANIAVIDDPLSEQDAMSKAAREHVIRWYPGGLRTRLMPGGKIVLCMTRWHQQDLAGWLLDEAKNNETADQWEVVDIPAQVDEKSAELLNEARDKLIVQGYLPEDCPKIEVGGSYWPPRKENMRAKVGLRGWTWEELKRTRDNMPPSQWNALYLQKPVADEGGILKREWWQKWESSDPPPCEYIIMSCDTAFETTNSSDYSAITVWGIFRDKHDVPNMILLAAKKGRYEYPDLRELITKENEFYEPDTIIIEKKASGHSLLQDLYRAGLPVIPYTPEKDKVTRAHACTPILHAGRVWVPPRRFAEELMNECANFPNGTYDDFVDSTTQAILWMLNGTWVRHPKDRDIEYTKQKRAYY